MWLLDTTDLHLKHIADRDLEVQPGATTSRFRYGILSHRWEEDGEPIFEQYKRESVNRPSCAKIGTCCQVARSHGLDLVWVDTCQCTCSHLLSGSGLIGQHCCDVGCIDKRSSAELQEAINSMYRLYERADVCFAYLRDVSIDTFDYLFGSSEWFRRGWTLQELLAPTNIEFYDRNWNFLGTKQSLSYLISAATGIQEDVLLGKRQLRECSVAQRMSWAARRVTTRIEDRAYSLLGIFDINMTMLYGEGTKSFLRLQEEILKSLDDHSIFVWKNLQMGLPGLLASSPEAFTSSSDIVNIRDRNRSGPYSVNNRGVHGRVQIYPYTLDTYLMVLPCARQGRADPSSRIGIFLRRLFEDDQFMRVPVNGEELMENAIPWTSRHDVQINRKCIEREISIRQRPLLPGEMANAYVKSLQGFRLNEGLFRKGFRPAPPSIIHGTWNSETQVISLPPGAPQIEYVGSIDIGPHEREIEMIRFGFDDDYNPIVHLTRADVHCSGAIWSQCIRLSDSRCFAWMSPNINGCWALKADRMDGLDVRIVRTDQRPDNSIRLARIGRVLLRRNITNECLIWDLNIVELAPRKNLGSSFLEDFWPLTTNEVNTPLKQFVAIGHLI